jgi:hypothetical protein
LSPSVLRSFLTGLTTNVAGSTKIATFSISGLDEKLCASALAASGFLSLSMEETRGSLYGGGTVTLELPLTEEIAEGTQISFFNFDRVWPSLNKLLHLPSSTLSYLFTYWSSTLEVPSFASPNIDLLLPNFFDVTADLPELWEQSIGVVLFLSLTKCLYNVFMTLFIFHSLFHLIAVVLAKPPPAKQQRGLEDGDADQHEREKERKQAEDEDQEAGEDERGMTAAGEPKIAPQATTTTPEQVELFKRLVEAAWKDYPPTRKSRGGRDEVEDSDGDL